MKQLIFTFKFFLFEIWTLLLNTFYYFRYFYNVKHGHYNKDYTSPKDKNGYVLKFEDDFNNADINWSLWNRWYSNGDSINPDTASYIPQVDCLNVENGILKMKVDKNTNPNFPQIQYKAGNLYTSGNYTQNYGWFEICCKVPAKGKMFWPCFWLWGNSWPPEIDIFEFMDKEDVNTEHTSSMSMTVHWGLDNKMNKSNYFSSQLMRTLKRFFGIKLNFDEHFHTMAIDWTPEYIDFYLDDIKIYRAIYFIPSNKMGIEAGVSVSDLSVKPQDKDLPAYFLIDYIRAYGVEGTK
jgi:beta-glucanase (GH16 family)